MRTRRTVHAVQRPGPSPRSPAGFTLIELLVVVAIITSLLALLLPSMSGAMAVARSAKCMSVQRQVALANLSYAADNQRVYVYNTYGGSSYQGKSFTQYWANDPDFVDRLGLTTPEVSNAWLLSQPAGSGNGWKAGCNWPDSFDCPDEGQPDYWVYKPYWWHKMGIAYNREYNGRTYTVTTVRNPAGKFQFGDSDNWWMNSTFSAYRTYWDPKFFDNGGFGGMLPRHALSGTDGANIAFYDGHVERVPKDQMYFYAAATGATPNANANAARWDPTY